MKKIKFYTEAVYIIGLALIAFGAALTTKSDFGISMVIAPAYLISLKVSEYISFFTFGMAEYLIQGLIIVFMMIIIRKFRFSYLISFLTAVIYGSMLDGFLVVLDLIPISTPARIVFYVSGLLLTAFGVAMMFKTYISPEAYELFVKEISNKYNLDISKFKTYYDCVSCLISIILSFLFFGFGKFVGINVGTIISALLSGRLIGIFSKFLDNKFNFVDKFKFRYIFE